MNKEDSSHVCVISPCVKEDCLHECETSLWDGLHERVISVCITRNSLHERVIGSCGQRETVYTNVLFACVSVLRET